MPEPALALAAQGLGWAVLMPILARLAERLDGFQPAAGRVTVSAGPRRV
jgi:hypothetical protein